jgi:hypothetical protein
MSWAGALTAANNWVDAVKLARWREINMAASDKNADLWRAGIVAYTIDGDVARLDLINRRCLCSLIASPSLRPRFA